MATQTINPDLEPPATRVATPMHLDRNRPTFHVSHGMVCFIGGIGVALGVMWLMTQMNSGKKSRD